MWHITKLFEFELDTAEQWSSEVGTNNYAKGSIKGLVEDCGISSANALELPQSCTNPSIYEQII